MRKVIAGLFISLDGVTESPDKWQFDHFDSDMMAALTSHIVAEDAILLGRVTYQEWATYFPTSTDEPYASHINNTPKYVVRRPVQVSRSSLTSRAKIECSACRTRRGRLLEG